ncbi:MAG: L-threonylcarbamoyladenylate synthase [Vicinamibacteria bacterium]
MAAARKLSIDPRRPDPAVLDEAVALLREGGVVAYPTETFYGLGVDARSGAACERLFELKGRPAEKALPCIVSGISQMEQVGRELSREAMALARHFWPGPLTLIVSAKPEIAASSSEGTIALRASGLPAARLLAERLGSPLTATSANASGLPSAATADEVVRQLGHGVDLLLDGGSCPGGLPSTIVDVRGEVPALVREGRVPFEEVMRVLSRASSP